MTEASPHLITPRRHHPCHDDRRRGAPRHAYPSRGPGLLPREHRLDTGDIAADHRVTRRLTPTVALVGPVRPDTSWQARRPAGGEVAYGASDWAAQTITCPQGHRSRRWTPTQESQHGGQALIASPFDPAPCAVCPVRARCTQAKTGPRTLTRRPQPPPEALQAARQCQTTAAFQATSAARAGVEGTLSQGPRAFPVRQTRSIGLAQTPLPHLLLAMAMHLGRVAAWWVDTPRAPTRLSAVAALAGACGCMRAVPMTSPAVS